MAPKKQQTGKGKGIASGSGSEHPEPARGGKRTKAQMRSDAAIAWRESIDGRKVKNERHIIKGDPRWPDRFEVFTALEKQGLIYWYTDNPGYNYPIVSEFYKNMRLPEEGTCTEPGARIYSVVGRNEVWISADKIADLMNYVRPAGMCNYPLVDGNEIEESAVVEEIYEHVRDWRTPHVPGKFKPHYRILNQLVCFNLAPRATENKPPKRVGEILWSLTEPDTRCDWALFIFSEMWDFRDAPTHSRMPFPCMLTRLFQADLGLGGKYLPMEKLDPGHIDATILARSHGQTKDVEYPLLRQPPPNAPFKKWFKKLFCMTAAVIESHKKIKKEQREEARLRQMDRHELHYIRQRVSGETSAPYVPLNLPPVEVSDDFVDENDYADEEEESDANDE